MKAPGYIFLLLFCMALLVAACEQAEMHSVYLANNQEALYVPYQNDERPVRFDVEPGTPARAIATNLREAGLIGDTRLFEAYVRANNIAQRLEAGTYLLSPSMTMVEIVEALQNSRAQGIAVTIPEGWRLEQTADYLSEAEVVDGDEYRSMALSGELGDLDTSRFEFLNTRPAGASLEGYLFPDTYELPAAGATASDLLNRQLSNFAAQVVPLYEEAVTSGSTDLDLYAVLVVASIVEREAVVPDERPAIAGVYLNRLAIGMRLEADPTVQYAMGYQPAANQWWKTPVFLEEYSRVDSPYNTYLYPGIPPGPIASPGLGSIRAVLYPEEHNYIFFVATPDGTGAHIFAETWDEHVQNVRRYQQGQ
jgi:UPF0755 protein